MELKVVERLLRSARPCEEDAMPWYNKPPSCRNYFDNQWTVSYFVHPDGTDPPGGSDKAAWHIKPSHSWRAVKDEKIN